MQKIPVYMITGFLESGKTSFLQDIVTDEDFTEGQRCLLIVCEEGEKKSGGIDKLLLYELGYSGVPDASARRRALLGRLGLPELMTTAAIADILNTMITADELADITAEIDALRAKGEV